MTQAIPSRSRPVVALMTDFGLCDSYVGVMKGVITSITSDVLLIDITHEIEPQNIASGAWTLAGSYRYFPRQTVFICVVDPGVGSSRRAIALHAGDWFFVGPDNGLFSNVLAEQTLHAAVVLSNPLYHLAQVSATFHGRDIFAPVGAHLARGVAISDLGAPIASTTLQRLDITSPVRQGGHIAAHIVHIDHFGNLISDIPLSLVPELFSHLPDDQPGKIIFPTLARVVEHRSRFFAAAPANDQPFIYQDSSGYLGIAIKNGNASLTIGATFGTPITYLKPEY